MINLLTFDIEEWFQANYPEVESPNKFEHDDRLEFNVRRLLNLCERHKTRATFFILAQTAERYPGVILRIKERGHEIASHGYHHALVYQQAAEEFAADLGKSLDILEGITQEKILGYRAPSWSVFSYLEWFYKTLERNGLVYDSSLFPAKTFLFGDKQAGRFPHRINGITEFPASTLSFLGRRIPFANGFFFRFFPSFFIKMGINILNKRGQPAMICLHPREIDAASPRLALPRRERFIHYVNLKTAEKKLDALLRSFKFCSIKDYLFL